MYAARSYLSHAACALSNNTACNARNAHSNKLRFDIVLLLLDQHEPDWDEIVSEHVLAQHQQADQPFTRQLHGWTVDELRSYVMWARAEHADVDMSSEAEAVLLAYYQQQRRAEERSQARTTIRMLESLVRVSQVRSNAYVGHARG